MRRTLQLVVGLGSVVSMAVVASCSSSSSPSGGTGTEQDSSVGDTSMMATDGGEGPDATGTQTPEAGPDVGTSPTMTGDSSDSADVLVADAQAGDGGDGSVEASTDAGEQADGDAGITDAGLDCSQGCSAQVASCTKPQDCPFSHSCCASLGVGGGVGLCTGPCGTGSLVLCGDNEDCPSGRDTCVLVLETSSICESPDGNYL